jgi:hypothetical protein
LAHYFFQTRQGTFKIWLFLCFGLFRSWCIHATFFKRRFVRPARALSDSLFFAFRNAVDHYHQHSKAR